MVPISLESVCMQRGYNVHDQISMKITSPFYMCISKHISQFNMSKFMISISSLAPLNKYACRILLMSYQPINLALLS